jgi:hypothetical protein
VCALSDQSLQHLGAQDIEAAKNHSKNRLPWLSGFFANLESCLNSAFPAIQIENNTTGARQGAEKRKFKGKFVRDLRLR